MDAFAQQNGNDTAAGGQSSSVLVSGASFAGLATAWWMNKLGYSVTVVEIAKGLRKGGTPINIREGVIDVVKRMNLLERIMSESLLPRPVTFLDAGGSPLPLVLAQAEEEPEEEYEIERCSSRPAAGMGGSVAILGAAALADALQKYPGNLRTAFQEYDESFRPIVEGIQAHAVEFGLELFMPRSEESIQRRNMQLSVRE